MMRGASPHGSALGGTPEYALDARAERPGEAPALVFEDVYEGNVDFVLRSLQRLGVAETSVDDAAQDVFVVVHRRLASFDGSSSIKTWLFGVALRVAHDYRRRLRRKGGLEPLDPDATDPTPGPEQAAARSQALRRVDRALDRLDDDKRAVFILAELEQMTAPEIADALSVKLNTVYSRLRAARVEFERALDALTRGTP